MRVIAGSARRLTLTCPKGMATRPTSDKVKETLFNILAPELYDAEFLDLFAGSGGIGIEALSRGAKHCTFIEKDKAAIDCIKKNLSVTRFTERSTLLPYDVTGCLYNLHPKDGYDIIFMDPPYDTGIEKTVLTSLSKLDIVKDDTLIIVEASIQSDMSYAQDLGFDMIRIKNYKNNKHVFMKRRSDEKSDISGQL
ncbi:MAG: 16S rRNA (guanine(966)-N(2))-methyltransferase RsmD [Lachnospiraceae bacterium]|nr:16S rRNA (guanine(966)-N(2))-methyltransferase RsmD [Lachnospiraceae bacterium]